MSQPSIPQSHDLEIAQMESAQHDRAQQEADKKAAERKTELAGLRSNAGTAARGNVNSYFTEQGLDPAQYAGGLDQYINNIMAGVPQDDPNPGSYFQNAGQGYYDQQQGAYRNRNARTLDSIFAPNFAETRIPSTLDDPNIASYENEQRGSADAIIKNMLARHVITQTGFNAANSDLDRQQAGVHSRLDTIGQGLLAGGQDKLRGIANKARSTAQQLNLGSPFDPYSYSSEADQAFNDFLGGLGGNLRAAAPGNLFQTSGLAAIAGAGSGAQNTAFDPDALAGVVDNTPQPARTVRTSTQY